MKFAQEICIKMYCSETYDDISQQSIGINPLIKQSTQQSTQKFDAVITLKLQSELFWFQGHFPGYSILPGVVQVNWAIEYFKRLFDTDLIFKGIDVVKFQKPLFPNNVIELCLNWNPCTQKLYFEYRFNGERTGSGKITFG